jgi:phosphatidylglycerophosphatase A
VKSFKPYDLSYIINAKRSKFKAPKGQWYTVIVTFFYIGLIGFMPGTLGSAAVFPIYAYVFANADTVKMAVKYFSILTAVTTFIAYFAIKKFQDATLTHDHESIVIDEVIGMLLTLTLVFPEAYTLAKSLGPALGIRSWIMAFLIVLFVFRIFDIAKPFFIKTIDREVKGPMGVILDDAFAGLFAALTIYITSKIMHYINIYV